MLQGETGPQVALKYEGKSLTPCPPLVSRVAHDNSRTQSQTLIPSWPLAPEAGSSRGQAPTVPAGAGRIFMRTTWTGRVNLFQEDGEPTGMW